MIFLAWFLYAVVIIYIIGQTLKRQKMNNAEATIVLFAGFLTVVSGTVAMSQEIFPNSRIIILLSTGLACIVVGIFFYRHNKPKQQTMFVPVTSIPSRWKRFKMALFVSLAFFEAAIMLSLPFLSWQLLMINGMPVITYVDLFLIGVFIAGLFIARSLYRFFKSTPEERLDFW